MISYFHFKESAKYTDGVSIGIYVYRSEMPLLKAATFVQIFFGILSVKVVFNDDFVFSCGTI